MSDIEIKMNREAELRREEIIWEKYYDHKMLSDRGAIDIGIGALKTVVLINAGALVALIAFAAQLFDSKNGTNLVHEVFSTSKIFMYGLIAASAAFLAAYFYQGAVTSCYDYLLSKLPIRREPLPCKLQLAQWIFGTSMIVLGVGSLIAFVVGSVHVFDAFTRTK